MPHCLRSKCYHRDLDSGSSYLITAWYNQPCRATCTVCGKVGPLGYNFAEAIENFWREDAKENTVSTSDYRRGVEDALTPITYEDVQKATVSSPEAAVNVYNRIADARRKSLLTKKVTKWVAIGISPSNGKPYSQGYFQDTKEAAFANKTSDPGDPTFIGVYPIEIEVPID